jgi:peptidoglycan/xylan/chitin deacetylase (PgdA/CDA1 family)
MVIINYHQLSSEGGSSRHDLPEALFRAQLDTLIDLGFSFVTLAELLRGSAEEEPRQCAITFDDGRLGAYEHGARILRARGIRATYFICPEWLERRPTEVAERYSDFMTWDQVVELTGEGNVIGSHGQSHLRLVDIDAGSASREVSESKSLIERRLGASCDHFAAPWGQIDRSVMDLVQHAGYRTLSSTVRGPNKLPYQLYRLRRLDSSSYPSVAAFDQALRRHVDAHSRLDVVLLTLPGAWPRVSHLETVAQFDLAVCLDDAAYELCVALGLPCLRHRPAPGHEATPSRERLVRRHGDVVRDREITFTPLTLSEDPSEWTSPSSSPRAMSSTRSDTPSPTSTPP